MLLTGVKPEPTFLIAKPFKSETVKAVIGQALFFEVRSHRSGLPIQANEKGQPLSQASALKPPSTPHPCLPS